MRASTYNWVGSFVYSGQTLYVPEFSLLMFFFQQEFLWHICRLNSKASLKVDAERTWATRWLDDLDWDNYSRDNSDDDVDYKLSSEIERIWSLFHHVGWWKSVIEKEPFEEKYWTYIWRWKCSIYSIPGKLNFSNNFLNSS